MFRAATALRRPCLQYLALARQPGYGSCSSLGPVITQRAVSQSATLQSSFRQPERPETDLEELEAPKPSKSRIRPANRASLHVSGIPPETTDEEFRQAFSVLPGLVDTQLVFNSGPLRNYQGTQNRGFGFLHFENPAAASAAAKFMRTAPIRLQGYATEINPFRAVVPPPNEPTHVLLINGLPLEMQYLEVMTLLKDRCPYYKSIRFMAGKPGTFLGVAGIAFADVTSATRAKERLHNETLGGVLLRDHNIVYGRPLYEDEPTNTLMILGTTKDQDEAFDFRRKLDEFSCIERYKLVRDRETREYRGFTIIGCDSVEGAWELLAWFNREYPHCRATFIVQRREYEKKLESQGRPLRANAGGRLRPRQELDVE